MTDLKKFKLFLAIYFPVFITTGILLRDSHLLKPFGYVFSAITLVVLGWLLYVMKFKKR